MLHLAMNQQHAATFHTRTAGEQAGIWRRRSRGGACRRRSCISRAALEAPAKSRRWTSLPSDPATAKLPVLNQPTRVLPSANSQRCPDSADTARRSASTLVVLADARSVRCLVGNPKQVSCTAASLRMAPEREAGPLAASRQDWISIAIGPSMRSGCMVLAAAVFTPLRGSGSTPWRACASWPPSDHIVAMCSTSRIGCPTRGAA